MGVGGEDAAVKQSPVLKRDVTADRHAVVSLKLNDTDLAVSALLSFTQVGGE